MLILNPSSLRATLGDAAASAAPGSSPLSSSDDPAGFASLLRQTQVVSAPSPAPVPAPAPAPAPAASADKETANEPAAPNEGSDDTPAPQESDTTQRSRALLKGKLRAADGVTAAHGAKSSADADDTHGTQRAEASDKLATGDGNARATQATGSDAPIDPNVMQWLAGLQRAAAGQSVDTKAGADGKAVPADTDTGLIETRGAAKGARAADLKADAESKQKAVQDEAHVADGVGSNPFAAALAEHTGPVEKPQVKAVEGAKDVAAAGASALAPAPNTRTDAPAPVAVTIATPVTAPDFAQELGLRLSTFAKDGVQTAELHLNPADMGPVSVQIVMDGTQARVDFGADIAATRQAIEAGLPELASALADAGFTLAGGGVSQHAGGRSGGGNDAGSSGSDDRRRIATEDQVKRVATAARRIVSQGGIDLFA